MDWKELVFWTVLSLLFFGAFDGLKDIIKTWINARYAYKHRQEEDSK